MDLSLFLFRTLYSLRGEYSLAEEIERFIRMWAGAGTGSMAHKVAASSAISVATKIASLAHLKKLLKTSKTDLNRLLKQAQMPYLGRQQQQAPSTEGEAAAARTFIG
jgi:hypothetical protein